jgi:tetratricopeptide (TPR) repeat protein
MQMLKRNSGSSRILTAAFLIVFACLLFGAGEKNTGPQGEKKNTEKTSKKEKRGFGRKKEKEPQISDDELLFNVAESHYQGGEYKDAQLNYMELIRKYPFSSYVNKAQFMIAKCYLELDQPDQAIQEFKLYTINNKMDSELIEAHEWVQKLERQIYGEEQQKTRRTMAELIDENFRLRENLKWLKPTVNNEEVYLELNLADNELMIKMGTQELYNFHMVSGKGRTWVKGLKRYKNFSTPKGIRHVSYKEKSPIWYRPNWSWQERGQEIPEDLKREDRAVPGVLGKYRVNLGEGYSIHGTSSGRIKPGKYSHGCIRMGARDLKKVFEMTEEGTKVFIY